MLTRFSMNTNRHSTGNSLMSRPRSRPKRMTLANPLSLSAQSYQMARGRSPLKYNRKSGRKKGASTAMMMKMSGTSMFAHRPMPPLDAVKLADETTGAPKVTSTILSPQRHSSAPDLTPQDGPPPPRAAPFKHSMMRMLPGNIPRAKVFNAMDAQPDVTQLL